MIPAAPPSHLKYRLIDSLYAEAMTLANEARSYFDEHGKDDRERLSPMLRVGFSCESLKVTTRLMHVIAWLLAQRAADAGLSNRHAHATRLSHAAMSDADILAQLPDEARTLIAASTELYERVKRIDAGMVTEGSPASLLIRRLQDSF